MKIALNSLFFQTPNSGSGQYLLHLLCALKEIDQQTLETLASSASDGCPLSKLIEAGAQVTVNATLEGDG